MVVVLRVDLYIFDDGGN